MRIGHPNVDFSEDIRKRDFSQSTLFDREKQVEYNLDEYPIITTERAEKYAGAIIKYMEKYGWTFFQQYSYLPNVLIKMNQLESEGKYWATILSGQADYFLRGLLIAKLCNDPQFKEKLSYVDNIFFDPKNNLEIWLPYYNRFKERLFTIKPKYDSKF